MTSTASTSFQSLQPSPGIFPPVHPDVSGYVDGLLTRHDEPVLLDMEGLARQESFPIVGRQVGVMLEVLTRAVGAKTVFELGSGYGYSAYWFTRGTGPEGKVYCTDGEKKNAALAEHYLSQVGRWKQIQYKVGRAQTTLNDTQGDFDIIYNDVDKGDYPEVWKMARERIRSGGLYIADNTLWSGRVTQKTVTQDVKPGWTAAIDQHNRMIAADAAFDFFMNPTRDGVIVARKR